MCHFSVDSNELNLNMHYLKWFVLHSVQTVVVCSMVVWCFGLNARKWAQILARSRIPFGQCVTQMWSAPSAALR